MNSGRAIYDRIRTLADVHYGTPASGDALVYNASTGKFEVRAITQADVSGLVAAIAAKANSSHTHTLAAIADAGTAAAANTGTTSGTVPILGAGGKLPSSMLPALAITDTFVAASQAAMLALSSAETGDVAVRTDINKTFILRGSNPAVLADWQEMLSPTDSVTSVNGLVGVVVLTGDEINHGLGYLGTTITEALEILNDSKASAADVAVSLAGKSNTGHTHTPSQVGLHPESVNLYGQLAQLGRGREFGARQVIVTAYGDGANNTVAIHRDGAAVSRSTSSTNRNAVYTVPAGYVAQLVYVAASNTTASGIPTQVHGPGQHRATTVAANSVAASSLADGVGTQGGVTIANELARSLTPLNTGESIGFESSASGLLTAGVYYVAVIVEIPTSIGKLGTATNFGTRTANAAILYTCPAGKLAYTIGQGPGKSAHSSFRVWVTHTTATVLRAYKLDAGETTSAVADNRLIWQYGSANMGNWGGFIPAPITLRAGESIAVDQSAGTATNGARVLLLEVDA